MTKYITRPSDLIIGDIIFISFSINSYNQLFCQSGELSNEQRKNRKLILNVLGYANHNISRSFFLRELKKAGIGSTLAQDNKRYILIPLGNKIRTILDYMKKNKVAAHPLTFTTGDLSKIPLVKIFDEIIITKENKKNKPITQSKSISSSAIDSNLDHLSGQIIIPKKESGHIIASYNTKLDFPLNTEHITTKIIIRNERPLKISRNISITQRCQSVVSYLKQLYKNVCQVCNNTVDLGNGNYYSEVHHIQPLGSHNGSDVIENGIVLCPNHHVMFDRGAITIDLKLRVVLHTNENNELHNKPLFIRHFIDPIFVKYHNDFIYQGKTNLTKMIQTKNKTDTITAKIHQDKEINLISYGHTVLMDDTKTNDRFEIKIEKYHHREFMTDIQKTLLNHSVNDTIIFRNCTYKIISIKKSQP